MTVVRHNVDDAIDHAVTNRLDRAGFVGVGVSKGITPVLTGYLRSRTRHEVERIPLGWRLRIGNPTKYGPYVHEGTRYMRPRPFLTPVVHDPAFKAALRGS